MSYKLFSVCRKKSWSHETWSYYSRIYKPQKANICTNLLLVHKFDMSMNVKIMVSLIRPKLEESVGYFKHFAASII